MAMRKFTTNNGFGQWAHRMISWSNGCPNDCLYCWARANACRFKRKTPELWRYPVVDLAMVERRWGALEGTTALPGTHDITPRLLGSAIRLISNLLAERNRLLIVTKAHYLCVKAICDYFQVHPNVDCIEWRFTITTPDDGDRAYWEPGAPSIRERVYALAYAYAGGYRVSVNTEPLICNPRRVPELVGMVEPMLLRGTSSIWLGPLNRPKQRVIRDTEGRLERLLAVWEPSEWARLYEIYGADELIRWKNGAKRILGLPHDEPIGSDR